MAGWAWPSPRRVGRPCRLADLTRRADACTPPLRSVALVLSLLHDTAISNAVMNANELARIFAPLLLRPQSAAASAADRPHTEAALALMISNGASQGALLASVDPASGANSAQAAHTTAAIGAIGAQLSGMAVGGSGGGLATVNDSTQWYYIDAQQNYVGPVDTHGLRQLMLHNYVQSSTYVWADTLSGWERISSLPQFAQAPPPGAPAPPAPAPPVAPSVSVPSSAAASRIVAPSVSPASFAGTGGAPAAPMATPATTAAAPAVPPVELESPYRSSASSIASSAPYGRSAAATTVAGGGVAAPPSLGIARRERQGSAAQKPENMTPLPGIIPPGGGSGKYGGSAGALSSALPGSGAPPASPLVIGSSGRAGAPSPGPAASAVPSLPTACSREALGIAPTKAAPAPASYPGANPASANGGGGGGGGVFIPVPSMGDSDGQWSSGRGLRVVVGSERRVRAVISDDGEVKDGSSVTLAYIESNGEVGDAQMNFAGKAHVGAGQVVDHAEVTLGEFDQGKGYVKDAQGSVIAELSKEGTITNNGGQSVGTIEGFSYAHMPTLAAYFLIVDPAFFRQFGPMSGKYN